ncbi:MAG TPA: 16S rRNA (guanine(966)-N(2))-methyltransferase RsmD [Verrucomicrobiales bacterium]|jgi:16S rRNA (guanine966-N2)-methyltransferase|nr:16S rRNA (guanine(966)-N(2))-methyltransferase RsmD [Verrucomicrobiales bacterium]
MRIIGGTAAGLHFKVPKGLHVRPTQDRVKQAIFNRLGNRIPDVDIVDLFAGAGALGLECLSRGAASVTSVEISRRHASFIQNNLHHLKLPEKQFSLKIQDVFIFLQQAAANEIQFDLILADPPYGEKTTGERSKSLAQKLIDTPNLSRILKADGLCVLGHASRDKITIPESWMETKSMIHGDCSMRFLEKNNQD